MHDSAPKADDWSDHEVDIEAIGDKRLGKGYTVLSCSWRKRYSSVKMRRKRIIAISNAFLIIHTTATAPVGKTLFALTAPAGGTIQWRSFSKSKRESRNSSVLLKR